ncbi:MAG: DUF2793 domain-containing protein [Alphaproteobacteria bacterium]|nr:DUF2793 domain-containing protein [Alphaproteobacteria bacterium]
MVATSPTGAWQEEAYALAAYYAGWKIKTPKAGWTAWVQNENKLYYYTGSAWAPLASPFLGSTFSWNPGTLANGSGASSSSVTVTGAAFGDLAQVAAPYDLQGVTATAYVNAANSVVVRLQNLTGSSVSLTSGTWRVRVNKA